MKIIVADSIYKKTIGLLFKKKVNYGMFFPNVNAIHTYFMRFSIDVIGLNEDMIITEIHSNVKKNKILILKKSVHTLEFPKGYSINYHIGDKVKI